MTVRMIAVTLTDTQRANLLRLADYLESLPINYDHFDMSMYVGNSENGVSLSSSRLMYRYLENPTDTIASCGTVACALGHGPAAGVQFLDEHLYYSASIPRVQAIDWMHYAEEFVPTGIDEDGNAAYSFLFGAIWLCYDNHHWGAAARIRFLIANGFCPALSYQQTECEISEIRELYEPFRLGNRLARYAAFIVSSDSAREKAAQDFRVPAHG